MKLLDGDLLGDVSDNPAGNKTVRNFQSSRERAWKLRNIHDWPNPTHSVPTARCDYPAFFVTNTTSNPSGNKRNCGVASLSPFTDTDIALGNQREITL
jgi:hypothetical protein